MNENKSPGRSGAGRVSGREMADALADVLKEEEEKAQARKKPPRPGKAKTSARNWVALVVLGALSGYVWFGAPSWLQFAPPEISPELSDAGIRMEIFQYALLVEEFYEAEGRLPDDLVEAGEPNPEVEYEPIDARDYRLALAGPRGLIEYLSTDSLELFLGDSYQIIRQGGARP